MASLAKMKAEAMDKATRRTHALMMVEKKREKAAKNVST